MRTYPRQSLCWSINDWVDGDGRCPDFLEAMPLGTQAYTIRTLALHLLSMFDGDYELRPEGGLDGAKDEWVLSQWDPTLSEPECDSCGWYRGVPCDIVHQDASDYSAPSSTRAGSPNQAVTLQTLPDELLILILKRLAVKDILRFGQAYKKVAGFIEHDAFIRKRELKCFVTKENFKRSALGIGIHFARLYQQPGRPMESEFDLISSNAYNKLDIFNTAYGCKFIRWLPLPLSEWHWNRVKASTYRRLHRLADIGRPRGLVDCMDVLTAFIEDQVTKLFTSETCYRLAELGLLRPSEKGIESLFFLFHLLLCVVVDHPEYVAKANKMIVDFQSDDARLKDMPSPGRLLAALLISSIETDANFLRKIVFETITRNVPRLLREWSELEYMEYGASPFRLHHTFVRDEGKYRALMFLNLFQRTVRSANLGWPRQDNGPPTFADFLKARRNYFFHRCGFPPSAVLAALAAELPRIRAIRSFSGCLDYLGVYHNVDERFLAARLRDTVRECLARGDRTPWSLGRGAGAALRIAAEEESPLPESEYLRRFPGYSSELDHEMKTKLARCGIWLS